MKHIFCITLLKSDDTWRRNGMQMLSALKAYREGNHRSLVASPHKWTGNRSFDVFTIVSLTLL